MESQWYPPTWNFVRDATAAGWYSWSLAGIRGRCLAVEAVVAAGGSSSRSRSRSRSRGVGVAAAGAAAY